MLLALVVGLTALPAWAVTLGGGFIVSAALLKATEGRLVPVTGDARASTGFGLWAAAFVVVSIVGAVLFALPAVRRLLSANRPVAGGDDPAAWRPAKLVGALVGVTGSAVLAGVSGVLSVRLTSAAAFTESGQLPYALAAVLLGGVSVFGRRAGVFGVVLGVVIIDGVRRWQLARGRRRGDGDADDRGARGGRADCGVAAGAGRPPGRPAVRRRAGSSCPGRLPGAGRVPAARSVAGASRLPEPPVFVPPTSGAPGSCPPGRPRRSRRTSPSPLPPGSPSGIPSRSHRAYVGAARRLPAAAAADLGRPVFGQPTYPTPASARPRLAPPRWRPVPPGRIGGPRPPGAMIPQPWTVPGCRRGAPQVPSQPVSPPVSGPPNSDPPPGYPQTPPPSWPPPN